MAKIKESKMICLRCGEDKNITRDFYKSGSELYVHSNNRLTICKSCIKNRYEKLLNLYDGKIELAFLHLCYNLDIYFDKVLFIDCSIKSDVDFIGEYFRLLSTKDRRNKTSMNNLIKGESKEVVLDDGIISEKLIVKWGRGRDSEDYLMLEKRYQELLKDFPSKTPEEQYIIKDICKLESDIEGCRRAGKTDKIASLENIKSKKMKDLDIIPADKKNSMSDEDIKIFGMGMKIFENENPIPTVADMFKDIDNMNSYWDRTIVKPMARMQGLASGEYTLENGMDNIDFTPEYIESLNSPNGDKDE